MEHPIPFTGFSAAVTKVCSPGAPAPLKGMAASGVAPLGPTDLVTVLYFLGYEADQTISDKARATLGKLPEAVLHGALDQLDQAGVLDGLARLLVSRPPALVRIAFNRTTADETIVFFARQIQNDALLEMIAANEQRMLACPSIIEALYHNRGARMSTVDRAVELAVRNGLELTGIACFKQVKAAIEGELLVEAAPEATPEDHLFKKNLEREEWQQLDEEKVDQTLEAKDAGVAVDGAEAETVESLQGSLATMSISAKIRMATLGNSTQRALLIRDTNKLVVMAVIHSPSISDSEIGLYSRYRTLPEEAIRYIAANREWTKHYQVKLNLVQNPRTPIEYSMRFLPHLRVTELRNLERDKNVPQAISRAAKQLRSKRQV